jgi:hypothetical protein
VKRLLHNRCNTKVSRTFPTPLSSLVTLPYSTLMMEEAYFCNLRVYTVSQPRETSSSSTREPLFSPAYWPRRNCLDETYYMSVFCSYFPICMIHLTETDGFKLFVPMETPSRKMLKSRLQLCQKCVYNFQAYFFRSYQNFLLCLYVTLNWATLF